jgi:phospholipid transport system substrate-binding protein
MMVSRRFLLTLGAIGAALAAVPRAFAQPVGSAEATGFVRKLGDELVSVVNGAGSAAEKQAKMAPLVENSVDVDGIARFCLGRFWHSATPPQQQEFVHVFHKVLLDSIGSRLGEYQGVNFSMTQTVQREGATLVGTIITRPNQEPVHVQWLIEQIDGQPKIEDVLAEGTSLRLTQRSDYASYLTRNGGNVQALIAAMHRQVGA